MRWLSTLIRRYVNPSHGNDESSSASRKISARRKGKKDIPGPDLIWARDEHNGLEWPCAQMMVLEQYKILYLPIAKVANSTLKLAMAELSGTEHIETIERYRIHYVLDHYNTGLLLKDLPLSRARDILKNDDYFKFAVIRDPYERLVSGFVDKFVQKRLRENQQQHTRDIIEQAQGTSTPDFETGISFQEFVRCVTSSRPHTLDTHWRPQSLYLQGVDNISRLYPFTNLTQLQSDLAKITGKFVEFPHMNKARKSVRVVPGVANLNGSELDALGPIAASSFEHAESRQLVRDYYSDDYDLFYKLENQYSREDTHIP